MFFTYITAPHFACDLGFAANLIRLGCAVITFKYFWIMKTLKDNWNLVYELFDAWAYEVNESVLSVEINSLTADIGVAVVEGNCIAYSDIKILEKAFTDNELLITLIGTNSENMEIWFSINPLV